MGAEGEAAGEGSRQDLVVVSLSSVQRFITEARSTSDVAAASAIYAVLAAEAAGVFRDWPGSELVFPAAVPGGQVSEPGMPNRVVALVPEGDGAAAARKAAEKVRGAWRGWVRRVLGDGAPETARFPVVQWACAPPDPAGRGGYAQQWDQAHKLLAARKRVRDFEWGEWRGSRLCSLAPQWPAAPAPKGLKEHERATLSTAGWVKRRWRKLHGLAGFPSTSSIASAPFRRAVLEHLDDADVAGAVNDLARAARRIIGDTQDGDVRENRIAGLPRQESDPADWFASTGGPWVYEDRWQEESLARESKTDPARLRADAVSGREAAARLHKVMKDRYGEPEPAAYLAVLVQDIDSMGLFLGGIAENADGKKVELTAEGHRNVSSRLQRIAKKQHDILEEAKILGVPVYAGGDDLLAFTPARTALDTVKACQATITPDLPTASTAVLFFHHHAGLQPVLSRARQLLHDAKERVDGKHALAVGFIRRSGVSQASIQKWTAQAGQSAADLFGVFAEHPEHKLSPGLLADLDRDKTELAALSERYLDIYRAELARLVRRHTSVANGGTDDAAAAAAGRAADEAARALEWLGSREAGGTAGADGQFRPEMAARVGVFLRQEAR